MELPTKRILVNHDDDDPVGMARKICQSNTFQFRTFEVGWRREQRTTTTERELLHFIISRA